MQNKIIISYLLYETHVYLYLWHDINDTITYMILSSHCTVSINSVNHNKRLILGCSPPLWDNRPDSLIMAWCWCAWILGNKKETLFSWAFFVHHRFTWGMGQRKSKLPPPGYENSQQVSARQRLPGIILYTFIYNVHVQLGQTFPTKLLCLLCRSLGEFLVSFYHYRNMLWGASDKLGKINLPNRCYCIYNCFLMIVMYDFDIERKYS